ncbi:tetratricopeptide repeat protein [Roseivivax halodurans]|nr:tetratricopeptide repeat protein [Roseivivax halodurans]
MTSLTFKSIVTALSLTVGFSIPGASPAQPGTERSDELLKRLAGAEDHVAADKAERELRLEWSRSGSAAMDLLLKRGRDALEVNQPEKAIEHLTALTDHAPGFAEGWFSLATAYYVEEMYGPAAYALEHVLALNPDHFGALQGLGAIYDHLEMPKKAHEAYARAAEIRPHDEDLTAAIERLDREATGFDL